MRIRTERLEDAAAVAEMHVRAWQEGYAGIMPAEFLAGLDPAAWADRRRQRLHTLQDSPFTSLVAEDDGALVGFATFGPYQDNRDGGDLDHRYGEVLAIYVEPARWRDGIGRALYDAAAAELAGRGAAELRLWVLADNVRARRFYQRVGLAPDGHRGIFHLDSIGGPAWAAIELVEVRYSGRLLRPGHPATGPARGTTPGDPDRS